PARQQRGERHVPPGLPLRQAHQLEHQDPGAGEGRWPLADPGRKGGQVRRVLLSVAALGFAVAAAAATPEDRLSAVFEAIEANRSRLYVFGNDQGRPRLVADFYVTLGKNGVEKTREGDQKTPIGVYHVTGNLPRSKLTDFYGAGAFPINYPNEWDRRRGRKG